MASKSNSGKDVVDAEEAALLAATKGFDHLFSNRLADAREQFASDDSPYHLLGQGVCAFMQAALGMETNLMGEAARCLSESEAGAKKGSRTNKSANGGKSSFPPGIEFEILQADVIVLQGLVHALSESYMGYLQCLYALNNAHSRFTKLYKTVFPTGIDSYITPATTPIPSRSPSTHSLASAGSVRSTTETVTASSVSSKGSSFLGRWGLSASNASKGPPQSVLEPEGPVEELIVSGAAFGYGLFNLVFSLLPAKVKTVVGLFGFQHDRRLALQALAVSAARKDVHAVFSGLTLMTYHGVVLLMSGYQADEAHIVKQYKAIVDSAISRYPDGALWILNRAKILRMTYDPEGAIAVLQDGLRPERPGHFQQADALLVFELAWTLLSQRRYQEAADMFMRMTEVNTWSHAMYYMLVGGTIVIINSAWTMTNLFLVGCYVSLGDRVKAKELFDKIPSFLDKRKIGGKEIPMETVIRKKLAFYKAKAKRNGSDESAYVDFMKISPTEELAIIWNTHQRITKEIAVEHIKVLTSLSPPVAITTSSYVIPPDADAEKKTTKDLDTPDELAIRSFILGIVHRTLEDFASSRAFLTEAYSHQSEIIDSKWVGGVALFELAVLDLKELEFREKTKPELDANELKSEWAKVLKTASEKIEKAMSISGSTVDLSSRLDGRVNMLRDEIGIKREMLGL
ncbi:uncharacterized protein FOMMEDRAFT_159009 [Fomitiporia mediterranea MF3/22]|uniref:uncharacterized protein n=1 Tax=Fomitiporia mediterranea (strain MF3/22) TaxID=694068 RepID=UPI0004408EA1|nr:uncharacterized protein FOMMEDRAFT_159009 [Fomitiporia mediterranea MF3/22]EJD00336.1 hypothetical protein FOMMEDRAFT_159009 [Fomitiporia mediterranea MF3/22]